MQDCRAVSGHIEKPSRLDNCSSQVNISIRKTNYVRPNKKRGGEMFGRKNVECNIQFKQMMIKNNERKKDFFWTNPPPLTMQEIEK